MRDRDSMKVSLLPNQARELDEVIQMEAGGVGGLSVTPSETSLQSVPSNALENPENKTSYTGMFGKFLYRTAVAGAHACTYGNFVSLAYTMGANVSYESQRKEKTSEELIDENNTLFFQVMAVSFLVLAIKEIAKSRNQTPEETFKDRTIQERINMTYPDGAVKHITEEYNNADGVLSKVAKSVSAVINSGCTVADATKKWLGDKVLDNDLKAMVTAAGTVTSLVIKGYSWLGAGTLGAAYYATANPLAGLSDPYSRISQQIKANSEKLDSENAAGTGTHVSKLVNRANTNNTVEMS